MLGLGDVYLGAPVATPLDPRHRLVTTKYNPARTWTAGELGGHRRRVPVHLRHGRPRRLPVRRPHGADLGPLGPADQPRSPRRRRARPRALGDAALGEDGPPWLLRFFDQIRWYEVGAEELLELRADVEAGQFTFDIEPTTFSVADHLRDLARDEDSIREFTTARNVAFEAERRRWAAAGIEMTASNDVAPIVHDARPVPEGTVVVLATVSGMVRTTIEPGAIVAAGDVVAVIEAMKMETGQVTPTAGVVADIRVIPGEVVGRRRGTGRDRTEGDTVTRTSHTTLLEELAEASPAERVAAAFEAVAAIDDPAVFIATADRDRGSRRSTKHSRWPG